jgi:hypothetical protein
VLLLVLEDNADLVSHVNCFALCCTIPAVLLHYGKFEHGKVAQQLLNTRSSTLLTCSMIAAQLGKPHKSSCSVLL